ncbi:MAG: hypothetical protein J7L58_03260 [Thermoplasmata archaeon]|nr:hypothetical protein [Thermoplasmata archaeon]
MSAGMRGKMLLCVIVVAFFMMPVGVKSKNSASSDFTHTVFVEYTTATWCPYCKYAHAALRNIYEGGWYPFYFVTHIIDKNKNAYTRAVEDYNIYYIPTVFFDGGYDVVVGADVTGTEEIYNESIIKCGERSVADIDVTVSAMWIGNATIKIDVEVHNNEVLDYEGYLKIYVVEKESSMGWHDTGGVPYAFPFLDYAFNDLINVGGKDSFIEEIVWNGNEHSNGYGITFSNIQPDNIMVIAAVFNSEWHQGYAVPPDGAPFDAYYIDDVSAAVPSVDENPPELSIENPAEGYLHIFGRKIVPVGLTVIIGDITVKATAKDDEAGVGSVEFYVDDELEKRYNFSALRMGMG